jgi:flagellar assembly factor FliW
MQQTLIEETMLSLEGVPAIRSTRQKPKEVKIDSRFGPITVQPANAISFPHGMPGIPGILSFCITNMPNIKNEQFKLMQCMGDHSLSFIVVPSTYDNQLLETADVEDGCAVLGITKENLLLLFIVTAHVTPIGRRLSVNAKAPIFVDVKTKIATQYVFQGNNYEIQHFIS